MTAVVGSREDGCAAPPREAPPFAADRPTSYGTTLFDRVEVSDGSRGAAAYRRARDYIAVLDEGRALIEALEHGPGRTTIEIEPFAGPRENAHVGYVDVHGAACSTIVWRPDEAKIYARDGLRKTSARSLAHEGDHSRSWRADPCGVERTHRRPNALHDDEAEATVRAGLDDALAIRYGESRPAPNAESLHLAYRSVDVANATARDAAVERKLRAAAAEPRPKRRAVLLRKLAETPPPAPEISRARRLRSSNKPSG